ncbi:MAG: hypothetical protein WC373_12270 [Smithella sp.]|jgi:hypothetical protein
MSKEYKYSSHLTDDNFLQDVRKILESGNKDDREYLALMIHQTVKLIELRCEVRKEQMEATPLNVIKGGLYGPKM